MNSSSRSGRTLHGMTAFMVVSLGQLISILATSMSQFALTIWVYEKTGSATALGLQQVFFIAPFLIISPIAGAMIDRYNRKLMMALSDIGAGIATIFVFAMQAAGALEIWHLYAAAVITGLFNAFQWPAYSASISLMLPKEQLGRANGIMSLLEAGPQVVAPILAGVLLPLVQLSGILLFDVVTFIVAVAALAIVFVPQPPRTAEGTAGQGSLLKESVYGFRYIFARPSLLGLQLVFFFGNLFAGVVNSLIAPYILTKTNNNELALGWVQSAGAIGIILGGVLLSAWGGFKRNVHGVLLGWAFSGVAWAMLMGLGHTLPVWLIAMFLGAIVIPTLNGSNQSIWQSKVAPDIQGRVFSARRLIAWLTNPITPILAGTSADFVFEPAFRHQATWTKAFTPLVGNSAGSGMALLMLIAGVGMSAVGLGGYFFRAVRNAETILPDHATPAEISA